MRDYVEAALREGRSRWVWISFPRRTIHGGLVREEDDHGFWVFFSIIVIFFTVSALHSATDRCTRQPIAATILIAALHLATDHVIGSAPTRHRSPA